MEGNQKNDYDRPVAYDADGRPLYAHPPSDNTQSTPVETEDANVSRKSDKESELEVKLKHDTSKKYFPLVTLRKNEYVIQSLKRHPIGLVLPFSIGILLMSFLMIILFNYDLFIDMLGVGGAVADPSVMALPIILSAILVAIGTYIAYFVYTNNKFFITNQSVIQHLQVGLFSKKEQTVSLENIEDASYHQRTLLQQFFNYGSIKITIEVNEAQFYRFTYVENPRECLKVLNNAIDARTKLVRQRR